MPNVELSYNDQGHLVEQRQEADGEARIARFGYAQSGFLTSMTDAEGIETQFERDAIGRLLSVQRGDEEPLKQGYNDLNLLSSVTPPGQPEHVQQYDAAGLLLQYVPPELSGKTTPTEYSYDADKALTTTTLPVGRSVERSYDNGGQLVELTVEAGSYQFEYDDATGALIDWRTPSGNRLSTVFDGPLTASLTQAGDAPGTVLFDARKKYTAKVRADGSLVADEQTGSIHKVAAGVQGAPACNGWTFWYLRHKGKDVPIDLFRQKLRAELN